MTAVEWLVETLNKKYGNDDFIITFINEIEQAKEIEKQQIEDANERGFVVGRKDIGETAVDYYEKTFKNK